LLESIIFHFVFVAFVLGAFVWWLSTKKKLETFKNVLIPIVLTNKIELPRDRSLIVRSIIFLEEELTLYYNIKVFINFNYRELSKDYNKNFLTPLCYLIWHRNFENNKNFFCNETYYTCQELNSHVKMKKNIKKLVFKYDLDKEIWIMEFSYE
jgi:hypothetical protein